MSDLMREEMKKAYEDVVGEPWDDAGLHKQAWCISWEKAWRASRECLVIELPYVHSCAPSEASSDQDYYLDEAKSDMRHQCRAAIHAAGVKTK